MNWSWTVQPKKAYTVKTETPIYDASRMGILEGDTGNEVLLKIPATFYALVKKNSLRVYLHGTTQDCAEILFLAGYISLGSASEKHGSTALGI